MEGQLPEMLTPVPLLLSDDINGGATSAKVLSRDSDEVTLVITLGAGIDDTADSQVTVVVNEYDAANALIGAVSYDHYWLKSGTTLAAGDGQIGSALVRLDEAIAIFTTALAAGDQEVLMVIPIRTRSLTVGSNSLAVVLTTVDARTASVLALRSEQYGAPRTTDLYP